MLTTFFHNLIICLLESGLFGLLAWWRGWGWWVAWWRWRRGWGVAIATLAGGGSSSSCGWGASGLLLLHPLAVVISHLLELVGPTSCGLGYRSWRYHSAGLWLTLALLVLLWHSHGREVTIGHLMSRWLLYGVASWWVLTTGWVLAALLLWRHLLGTTWTWLTRVMWWATTIGAHARSGWWLGTASFVWTCNIHTKQAGDVTTTWAGGSSSGSTTSSWWFRRLALVAPLLRSVATTVTTWWATPTARSTPTIMSTVPTTSTTSVIHSSVTIAITTAVAVPTAWHTTTTTSSPPATATWKRTNRQVWIH